MMPTSLNGDDQVDGFRRSQTQDAIEEESSRQISPKVGSGSGKRRSRIDRGVNAEVRSSMEGWS